MRSLVNLVKVPAQYVRGLATEIKKADLTVADNTNTNQQLFEVDLTTSAVLFIGNLIQISDRGY